MKKLSSLFTISLFSLGMLACVSANAQEYSAPTSSACHIRPYELLNSFSFSASGTNTGNIAVASLIPVGAFSQVGTATGTSATQSGNTITGKWSVTITQNDTSGKLSTYTKAGSYTLDATTCTGDFSWDGVGVVFRATFVKDATEFKSIASLPGVIIAYTGTKI